MQAKETNQLKKIKTEIAEQIESSEILSKEIEALIKNNEQRLHSLPKEFKRVKYFVVITMTISLLTLLYSYSNSIFGKPLGYVLIAIYALALGIYFWLLRERFRLIYSIIELIVGVTAIFIVLTSVDFRFEFSTWKFDNFMGIVGGLYILVRGIDNFTKTKYSEFLMTFFNLNKKNHE